MQSQRNLVRGNCSLTQNLPGFLSAGEIHDRRVCSAGGRAAIHDQWNALPDLVAYARRVGTLGCAVQIRAGGGNRQSERCHHSPGNCGIRHAQRHIAGVGGGTKRQLRPGAHNQRQRSGPEAFRQHIEGISQIARKVVSLLHFRDQERERLMLQAALDLVNALHGTEIDRVHGQAVEGVGRHANDAAGAKTRDDIFHTVHFRLIRMDAEYLC